MATLTYWPTNYWPTTYWPETYWPGQYAVAVDVDLTLGATYGLATSGQVAAVGTLTLNYLRAIGLLTGNIITVDLSLGVVHELASTGRVTAYGVLALPQAQAIAQVGVASGLASFTLPSALVYTATGQATTYSALTLAELLAQINAVGGQVVAVSLALGSTLGLAQTGTATARGILTLPTVQTLGAAAHAHAYGALTLAYLEALAAAFAGLPRATRLVPFIVYLDQARALDASVDQTASYEAYIDQIILHTFYM